MPNQQVESTLADLGIAQVSEKIPGLMDHYLGFELVTTNEEKTRAAGLLGFQVGNELLYIPLLFLNGKIKGTEVLYLKNSDVFTSCSKQWIEYLTSRNPGMMGVGSHPQGALQQPSSAQLGIFSNAPTSGKMAGLSLEKNLGEGASHEFWTKLGAVAGEVVDLPKRAEFHLPNVLRNLGKTAYDRFISQIIEVPELLEKVSHYYGDSLFLEFPESKTAATLAPVVGKNDSKKVAFLVPSDVLDQTKVASLGLTVQEQEQCLQDGFLVLDKRAAKEKTPLYKEDYHSRFSSPQGNGFYEIVNKFGQLEKVWVSLQPFVLDNPRAHYPGTIVLDLSSGIYVTTRMGEQIFVRSHLTPGEAVWKEKLSGATSMKSLAPNKSYILVSPDLRCSAPFRVLNKGTQDGETNLVCETPYSIGSCVVAPQGEECCGYNDTVTVRIVDREDISDVRKIGEVVFVPSSWKAIEVDDERSRPGMSDEERESRRDTRRKTKERITPGGSGVLTSSILNKGLFKLHLQKSGSYLVAGLLDGVTDPMPKLAAIRCLVEELGLSGEDALACWTDAMSTTACDRWIDGKVANFMLPGAIAGAGAGAISGLLNGEEDENGETHRLRSALTRGLAGAGIGGALGFGADLFTQDNQASPGPIPAPANGMAAPGVTPGVDLVDANNPETQATLNPALARPGNAQPLEPITSQSSHGSASPSAIPSTSDPSMPELPMRPIPKKGSWEQIYGGKAAAHGLNADGQIYSGTPFPDPQTQMGTGELGIPEQQGSTQVEPLQMNSMADPSQDWRNKDEANWSRINGHDVNFLLRAANSGNEQVFDSAMIGLLLRSNRNNAQVDEWLPDMVQAQDSKCRLLISFYWHNQDFAESYGKDEMAEFEDVLLNAINVEGKIILFLKQKAGESAGTKIDALSAE